MNKNPLIIALDVDSAEDARSLVSSLGDAVDFYKVGMELYAAEGISFVRELISEGKQVFLDLKMYDIGEQVKRAVAQIAKIGVRFLTVHARGQIMRAAVAGRGSSPLKLLGVTVLTSFDESNVAEDRYRGPIAEIVEARVRLAKECGIDGIVCSGFEVARVRQVGGPSMTIVVPGVRSPGASAGDQKRVVTPEEALAAGADYLVIGRQVTQAADPRAEALRLLSDVAAVSRR